jgi:hypothetical protein
MKTIFAAALLLALIPVPASAHNHVEPPSPWYHSAPRVYVAPPVVQYQDRIVRQPIIIVPRTLVQPEIHYAPPRVEYLPPKYDPPGYSNSDYWGAVVDHLEALRRGDQVLGPQEYEQ